LFDFFAKAPQEPAPQLRRALLVDADPLRVRALGELLRRAGEPDVWTAEDAGKALKLAGKVDPQIVFCELSDGVDGAAFTRALRRSEHACRKAPVVLVTADASPQALLAARDAGAHEALNRPILPKDLARRIEAALRKRDWIEALDYVGPDRRVFNSAEFPGPLKRLADLPPAPHAVRVGEALKIVRAACAALEADPAQARRALRAQAAAVIAVAAETSDGKLVSAVAPLADYLKAAGAEIDVAAVRAYAETLLAYGGRDQRAA
jgi:CheY-like chemotaxis protein